MLKSFHTLFNTIFLKFIEIIIQLTIFSAYFLFQHQSVGVECTYRTNEHISLGDENWRESYSYN